MKFTPGAKRSMMKQLTVPVATRSVVVVVVVVVTRSVVVVEVVVVVTVRGSGGAGQW